MQRVTKQKKQPGKEYKMVPRPGYKHPSSALSFRLRNKVAIITGGDSGIGRAIAVAFAKEGADLAIFYLNEHADARETEKAVLEEGRSCLLIPCDVGIESEVKKSVRLVFKHFKSIDILVNNAAEQYPKESILDITEKQLEKTFRTNIFSYFFMTKAVLPYLKKGSTIVNTTSVTAYRGSEHLLDYSSTKGAIVSFTRSLANNLVSKGIRVNAVAPGPIWTPLIVATFSKKKIKEFGKKVPMKRPGQPEEVAPSFVFLASDDSSYMTGQVLHPNGGEIINT
jgi:NAD(P)-dependent dehydrogenase (short-subunit alcohol dehydrogenase family)